MFKNNFLLAFYQRKQDKGKKSMNDYLAFNHYINGTLFEFEGDLKSAIREYNEGLKYEPNSYTLRMSLSEDYFQTGDYESALKEASKIQPQTAEVWAFLGDCYRSLNKKEQAVEAYARAVQSDTTLVTPYFYLAQVWQQENKLDSAIYAWRKVSSASPYNLGIYLNLGFLLELQGKPDEAIDEYQQALNLDPNSKQTLLSLGRVYETKKDFSQAIGVYEKLLAQDSTDVVIRSKLVQLYFNTGEKDKKAFRRDLSLFKKISSGRNPFL
jgi:tetratricopeptide (TPR) repeat protein